MQKVLEAIRRLEPAQLEHDGVKQALVKLAEVADNSYCKAGTCTPPLLEVLELAD